VHEVFASESVIERSPSQVWAALTDWDRAPDWMDGVEHLTADGPVAAGTSLTFRSNGRDRISQIVDAQRGRRLVIRSVLRGVTADYVYVLDHEAGATRLTLRATCAVSGLRRVLGPVLREAIRRTDSRQPEALRRLLEDG
jgi:uncharacterized protein YndB with AHSA1/START domain